MIIKNIASCSILMVLFFSACETKDERMNKWLADSASREKKPLAYYYPTCKENLPDSIDAIISELSKVDSLVVSSDSGYNCFCNLLYEVHGSTIDAPILREFTRYDTLEEGRHTPLQLAVMSENIKLVKWLLAHGADPNLSLSGQNKPLNLAVTYDNKEIARLLAQYQADLKGCYIMLVNADVEDLKFYKQCGVDFHLKHSFYDPYIHQVHNTGALKYLLELGCSPNDTTYYGQNLLHTVAGWGETEEVALALKYGADLYKRDNKGHTPLEVAVEQNNLPMVQKLLPLYDLEKAGLTTEGLLKIAKDKFSRDMEEYLSHQMYK